MTNDMHDDPPTTNISEITGEQCSCYGCATQRHPCSQAKPPPARQSGSAIISADGKYRYLLTRKLHVKDHVPIITFIMLNPSTANAEKDDATIRRCKGFGIQWGFAQLQVVNLFAFRATKPAELKKAADPYGPENKFHITNAMEQSNLIICAWGCHGRLFNQDKAILQLLQPYKLFALQLTKDGHPKHPLYVPGDREPIPFGEPG